MENEKEKSIAGGIDPYLEAVQKQSINRHNPLRVTQASKSLGKIRPDQRTEVPKREGALVKKIELKNAETFFPKGYEKIFLALYILLLPYFAGIIFLFFYVAGGNVDLFYSVFDKQNHILTWCIGYEILAVLTLIYLVKNAVVSSLRPKQGFAAGAAFRRP